MKIDIIKGTLIKTNNYIIGDEKEVVLIEASANFDEVKNKVADRKVLAVLLTHGHWDHFYYLDRYLSKFKCKVYMTKEAFDKINYRSGTFYADRNPNINLSEKDVCFIKDCDVLKFSNLTFNVIETKGHTDCSVSFLLNNEFLFSGDTLFKDAVGRCDLPTSNYQDLINSLKKLFTLNPDIIVYPGHGNSTTLSAEKENLKL